MPRGRRSRMIRDGRTALPEYYAAVDLLAAGRSGHGDGYRIGTVRIDGAPWFVIDYADRSIFRSTDAERAIYELFRTGKFRTLVFDN